MDEIGLLAFERSRERLPWANIGSFAPCVDKLRGTEYLEQAASRSACHGGLYKPSTRSSCSCRQGAGTVKHVLMECYLYQDKRRATFGPLQALENLSLAELLTTPKWVTKTTDFMRQTGRLKQFRRRNRK